LQFFSPLGNQALSFPGSCEHGNKRMKKEEAENAEGRIWNTGRMESWV
jgi:hypothetical protein